MLSAYQDFQCPLTRPCIQETSGEPTRSQYHFGSYTTGVERPRCQSSSCARRSSAPPPDPSSQSTMQDLYLPPMIRTASSIDPRMSDASGYTYGTTIALARSSASA